MPYLSGVLGETKVKRESTAPSAWRGCFVPSLFCLTVFSAHKSGGRGGRHRGLPESFILNPHPHRERSAVSEKPELAAVGSPHANAMQMVPARDGRRGSVSAGSCSRVRLLPTAAAAHSSSPGADGRRVADISPHSHR